MVFTAILWVLLSLGAVAGLLALLAEALEPLVAALFLVRVVVEVVEEFLLVISQHNALAVRVAAPKDGVLVVVVLPEVPAHQVALAHNQHTVLAQVAVAGLLHTLLPLVLVAQVVLGAVAVGAAEPLLMDTTLAQVVLVVLA